MSDGHRIADVDRACPPWTTGDSPWPADGQSTTANSSRCGGGAAGERGVHSYAVHPGVVTTDLFRSMSPQERF
ncbi:hypothetical protein [Trujillonella humicola]|uniref:hypothetical protein n=1 Tax=Trujillonella humicola TaxID=3383699 RepID=UPI003906AB0D